jgi:hypothetical protein
MTLRNFIIIYETSETHKYAARFEVFTAVKVLVLLYCDAA